ncbi:MAG: SDH family Clp fold serine proteinase [Opitutales bacterium]
MLANEIMQTLEATIQLSFEDPEKRKILDDWDQSTDIFVYCGEITYDLFDVFYDFVNPKKRGDNALLIITTQGGSADAAYRIARYFRSSYKIFKIAIPSDCKSAGTLLACGAHEIIMTPKGEFGPLDVQVFSPDEFLYPNSGLTITQALEYLEEKAFESWEKNFLKVRQRSGGIITTKTASEIASDLSIGIYSQISEKIDPSRVGELQRTCDIALHYGLRLGRPKNIINHLIYGYPSHSFVIDYAEARALFSNVRLTNQFEDLLLGSACDVTRDQFDHVIDDRLTQHEDYLIHFDIEVLEDQENAHENENDNSHQERGKDNIGADEQERNSKNRSAAKRTGSSKSSSSSDTPGSLTRRGRQ